MTNVLGMLSEALNWAPYPLLLILLALIPGGMLRSRLVTGMSRILERRNLFVALDLKRDVAKIELMRIATGVAILYRAYLIYHFLAPSVYSGQQAVAIAVLAGLGTLLTLGLATAVASLALLLLNVAWLAPTLHVWNLADIVLQMLLLVFTFLPAGTQLSLDAYLARSDCPIGWVSRGCFALFGRPTAQRSMIAKAAAFWSYGMISVSSALIHLAYWPWVVGTTNIFVLTSGSFSLYSGFFRDALENYPEISTTLMMLSTYMIVSWQILFIPFVILSGLLRRYAVFVGDVFFLASAFVLSLHFLPWFEFFLWGILFWEVPFINKKDRNTLDVLYDDSCYLCDRTVRFIRIVDLFQIVRFRPLSANIALLECHGISHDAATRDLYGLDLKHGRQFAGYPFYLELARRTLLLFPVWPVLLLGRWTGIGPMLYRAIAARRIRLFGVCMVSRRMQPATASATIFRETKAGTALFGAFTLSYLILALIFIVRIASLSLLPPDLGAPVTSTMTLTDAVGMTPIDVFNAGDLPIGQSFFTATAIMPDGSSRFLPLESAKGIRLAWMRSDWVFYANYLPWQRAHSRGEPGCLDTEADRLMLQRISAWAKQDFGRIAQINVDVYADNAALDVSRLPGRSTWDRVRVCHVELDPQGREIRRAIYDAPAH